MCIAGNFQVCRECRARCLRDTMRRPGSSLLLEGAVIGRMPVAGGENGQLAKKKCCNITVEAGNDIISKGHGKAAARQKIVLHVDYDNGVTASKINLHCNLRITLAVLHSLASRTCQARLCLFRFFYVVLAGTHAFRLKALTADIFKKLHLAAFFQLLKIIVGEIFTMKVQFLPVGCRDKTVALLWHQTYHLA